MFSLQIFNATRLDVPREKLKYDAFDSWRSNDFTVPNFHLYNEIIVNWLHWRINFIGLLVCVCIRCQTAPDKLHSSPILSLSSPTDSFTIHKVRRRITKTGLSLLTTIDIGFEHFYVLSLSEKKENTFIWFLSFNIFFASLTDKIRYAKDINLIFPTEML